MLLSSIAAALYKSLVVTVIAGCQPELAQTPPNAPNGRGHKGKRALSWCKGGPERALLVVKGCIRWRKGRVKLERAAHTAAEKWGPITVVRGGEGPHSALHRHCCQHNKVIAMVHPVYLINPEQHQVAADPQSNPTNLGPRIHLQAASVYTRHRHTVSLSREVDICFTMPQAKLSNGCHSATRSSRGGRTFDKDTPTQQVTQHKHNHRGTYYVIRIIRRTYHHWMPSQSILSRADQSLRRSRPQNM